LLALKGEPLNAPFVRAREITREELSRLIVKVFCKNVSDDQVPIVERRLDCFARPRWARAKLL